MALRGRARARRGCPTVPELDEEIPVRFIFDEHLPRGLSRALGYLREPVAHVLDFFPAGTTDPEFIEWAGKWEICILSRDTHIKKRPHELRAVMEHMVGVFYILPGPTSPTRCQLIQAIIKYWPAIKVEARKRPKPFFLAVRTRGGIVSRYT